MTSETSSSTGLVLFDELNARWKASIGKHLEVELPRRMVDPIDTLNRNCWSEGRLGVVMSKYLKKITEPDLRLFIRRHMLDEGKHYKLQVVRLKELGIDSSKYVPHQKFAEKFEVAESFDSAVEMYAFHPLVGEKVGEAIQVRLAEKFLQLKDFSTSIMFFNDVLPDEAQHTIYGPRYAFAKYANSPEMRERAEEAFTKGLNMSLSQYESEAKSKWEGSNTQ